MFRIFFEEHSSNGHIGEKHKLFDETVRVVVLVNAIPNRHPRLRMQRVSQFHLSGGEKISNEKKSEKYWGLRRNGWAGAVMAVWTLSFGFLKNLYKTISWLVGPI